jgi:MFS transporter, AAHS family, 4-hydroxybenzoate transporter
MRERAQRMNRAAEVDVLQLIEGQRLGLYQISIMTLLGAIMFFDGYDMQVLGYVAPALLKAWHIEKAQFGLAFGAGMAGFMLGATLLGQLGDSVGRKKMIVNGALLFGVSTAASGLATTLNALFVLRFIAGVGMGGTVPSAIALAAEFAPAKKRATKVSTMYVGYTLGSALSGFIAAQYIPRFGWPSVFYIGGIAPLVLLPALAFGLPESVRFLALKQRDPETLARILGRLRPDLRFEPGVRFVTRDQKQAGLPVRYLFTERRTAMTLLLWAANIGALMAIHFFTSWLPTVMSSGSVPVAHAIIATALFQLGGMAGCLLMGRFLDRYGVVAISASLIVAVVCIASIGWAGSSEGVLIALVFVAGFFLIGGQVGQLAMPGIIYPTYIRATGAGWLYGIGRFGSILGPVIGGVLISLELPLPVLFLFAASPALVSAVASFLLKFGARAEESAGEQPEWATAAQGEN